MKKLILAIVFLFFAGNAHALLLDVEYTGMIAERIDLCGYGCEIKTWKSYTSNLMYAGGPVANNSVGYAQQFSLDQETRIDYILASAHMDGFQGQRPDEISTATMYFKLYTGESTAFRGEPSLPYPDVSTASLVTPWTITSMEVAEYYDDIELLFGVTLQPGTYWIAQERYAQNTGGLPWEVGTGTSTGAKVDSISVKFAQNDLAVQHTPEPSTFLLFGLGLLGAFVRRRKRV